MSNPQQKMLIVGIMLPHGDRSVIVFNISIAKDDTNNRKSTVVMSKCSQMCLNYFSDFCDFHFTTDIDGKRHSLRIGFAATDVS